MKTPRNKLGLTELQTKFLSNLVRSEEFISFGTDTEIWTDYYCTSLDDSNVMNKMQSGACITTLAKKMFICVGKAKRGNETARYFRLKEKGVQAVSELIDLSKFTFVKKPAEIPITVIAEVVDTKETPMDVVAETGTIKDTEEPLIQEPIKVNDLVKCSEFDGRIKFRVQKIYDNGTVNIANMKKGSFTVPMNTLELTTNTVIKL